MAYPERLFHGRLLRCLMVLALGLLLAGSACGNPVVDISDVPLFSGRANVHPNLLLSLSVEFPTVGIAYRDNGGSYDRTHEYVGYFNPLKCYSYTGDPRSPQEDVSGGAGGSDYFEIAKDADDKHECGGDSFSGNFMNWASSSAIDMLRYALTGGDRIIDSANATVLQRAVLRDSESGNFYAHASYFPRREVEDGGNVSAPGQVTPFDTKVLYVVSCRNRILFSDSSSGLHGDNEEDSKKASGYCTYPWDGKGEPPPQAIDKKLGEYLVRVKVCDDAEGPARPSLCKRYGQHYKPVGEIQRRASRLRLAAMGYLLDDAATRYGGVLRAPMKYVGPTRFSTPGFLEVDNDRREWNPDTGVFYSNPEDPDDRDSSTVNSGVINYLNKFGRSGRYKTYDPVSELYYEGIRYLQGKAPTAAASADVGDGMDDGFPVLTDWHDPMTASCQANYILTIADVNTHWDRYIPGNDRTTFGAGEDAHDGARAAEAADDGTPELNVKDWTRKVGEMEVDKSGDYANASPNPALADLDEQDTGSSGHGTYYMAGLAYWAHTHDIRLDKPARVTTFTVDVDEGGNGQIDGNPRGIAPRVSQLYLAAKYGGFADLNGDGNPFITSAAKGDAAGIAASSEWDKDGNGVPDNYFLAGQPKAMIQAIHNAFARIGGAGGAIAGVALSGTRITAAGAYVFQPGFDSSDWSGSLKKFAIINDGGTLKLGTEALWDAGKKLTDSDDDTSDPARQDRHIYTGRTGANGNWSTVEFKWDALSEHQRGALGTSPDDGEADGFGKQRLDFLRGDRSKEQSQQGGIFRTRTSVLGDIINGNPVYVGAPASNLNGAGYRKFRDDHKNRTAAVYVGANDGMLHAFNADDGSELFAYLPSMLFPQLGRLAQPEYEHRPYVDGTLTAAEAKVGKQWKTVLAGGLGGGAQGVYALDVTDPAHFADGAGALFEFTDADDPDIGNVRGAPVIAKFRTGFKAGVPVYKYFLVVSSGLDNYRDDGTGRFNDDGAAALFLLSLDKPANQEWQLGVNYFKFRTPSSVASLPNGLAAPAPVVGPDGAVRYVYAGDLQGNLWRFNFTGAAPWNTALAGNTPLFTALRDKLRQPITVRPRVVFAPGGYLVLFGTGRFVASSDLASADFATQSFYGIYDTTAADYTVDGRDQLAARTLTADDGGAYTIDGDPVRFGSGVGQKRGWYFDFPDSGSTGERVVTNPVVAGGLLFFNSLIPGSDPCKPGGGRSYAVGALSGLSDSATGQLSEVGMPSAPVVLLSEVEVGDRNAIGRRLVTKRYTIFNFGSGGAKGMAAPGISKEIQVPAGRLSWREIINWEELHDAALDK